MRTGVAPGPVASAAVAAVQRRAEAAPLYAAAMAASDVASCRVVGTDGSVAALYVAGNGNSYRFERDGRIEYSDQEARFVVPPREAPLGLLQDAEREAFPPAGCGIDWSRPETVAAAEPAGAPLTVYRGDVCNCQGRLRRSSAGAVDLLGLRSTC